jgi:hypothetical protein
MKYSAGLVVPALAAGLMLGVTAPAHAYTINTTEVGKRIRWATDTVGLQMDPEFQTFLGPGDAYASLAMGFDAWRGLPRVPDLNVLPGTPDTLGNHAGHPTNGIYLLRDWPYEAAKLAVTIVTYEMDTGRLLDADIVVNGQSKFALLSEPTTPGLDSYDLAAVLTHESGHVLGLGESQAGEQATMWPYARPDDTQKRSLDTDDEDGVTESYLSAPPSAASGCGHNTVGGRASTRGGLAFCLWFMAVVPVLRITRRRKRQAASLLVVSAAALLVGFDNETESNPAQQRVAAVESLIERGTRDDLGRLQVLSSDGDAQLARRAHIALLKSLARPGAARIKANTPEGALRVEQLMGTGTRMWVGKAHQTRTLENSGLLFTEYALETADGTSTTLRVAGGSKDGISQRVMDAELPPADDQDVVVVPQANGSQHWAYHQAGLIFGGHSGDGAAIDGAL